MTEFTKTFRRTTYPTISPSSPTNNQSGRTVLVAGASEGIGFGIARAFAEANASKIILVSRSQERLDDASKAIKREHGNVEIETRVCDCSDVRQIEALWTNLANDNIFIDVFVQGACATQPPKTLEEQVSMINFNMIAHLHSFEHFRNQPNPSKKPTRLINVSSAGLHCYPYDMATYSATKAGFSDYLCHIADLIPESEMRVIVFHPGAVYTPAADKAGEVPKDLPIWDDPSLSAHMAVWLAGQDSGFLHGRFVWANWDADELMGMKDRVLADSAFLKVGITGVDSFGVKDLMDVCSRFPAPKREQR
jgi:short-subunit dehydrogenase